MKNIERQRRVAKPSSFSGAQGGTSGTPTTGSSKVLPGDGNSDEEDAGYSSSDSMSSVDERSPKELHDDLYAAAGAGNTTDTDSESKQQTSSDSDTNGKAAGKSPAVPPIKFPKTSSKRPDPMDMIVYLAGNSLGLQSHNSLRYIQEEIQMWQDK